MESTTANGGLEVRAASPADAGKIAELLGDLGYEGDRKDVDGRLNRLLGRRDAGALVAVTAENPIALASFQIIDLLERGEPQCRVTALVTGQEHRRRGAATALIRAVESAARERGCFRLEVTTRPDRNAALHFYAELGFRQRPHRLVKYLDDAASGAEPEGS